MSLPRDTAVTYLELTGLTLVLTHFDYKSLQNSSCQWEIYPYSFSVVYILLMAHQLKILLPNSKLIVPVHCYITRQSNVLSK